MILYSFIFMFSDFREFLIATQFPWLVECQQLRVLIVRFLELTIVTGCPGYSNLINTCNMCHQHIKCIMLIVTNL